MLYLFIIIPLIPLFVNPNHQFWVVKDSKLYQYIKHVQLKIIKNLFAKKNYYRNLCQTHTNPVSRFLSFILSLYLCFLFCVETQKMFEFFSIVWASIVRKIEFLHKLKVMKFLWFIPPFNSVCFFKILYTSLGYPALPGMIQNRY